MNLLKKFATSEQAQNFIKKEAEAQAEKQAVKEAMANLNFKRLDEEDVRRMGLKKGGKVSSASKRADGCAIRGKTRA